MSVIPIIASIHDVEAAIRHGNRNPGSRWYVAKRLSALGVGELTPTDWAIVSAGLPDFLKKGDDEGGEKKTCSDKDCDKDAVMFGKCKEHAKKKSVTAAALTRRQARGKMGGMTAAAEWDGDVHPRDRNGRFIEKFDIIDVFPSGLAEGAGHFRGVAVGNRKGEMGDDQVIVKLDNDVSFAGQTIKAGTEIPVSVDDVESAPNPKARLDGKPAASAPKTVPDAGPTDKEIADRVPQQAEIDAAERQYEKNVAAKDKLKEGGAARANAEQNLVAFRARIDKMHEKAENAHNEEALGDDPGEPPIGEVSPGWAPGPGKAAMLKPSSGSAPVLVTIVDQADDGTFTVQLTSGHEFDDIKPGRLSAPDAGSEVDEVRDRMAALGIDSGEYDKIVAELDTEERVSPEAIYAEAVIDRLVGDTDGYEDYIDDRITALFSQDHPLDVNAAALDVDGGLPDPDEDAEDDDEGDLQDAIDALNDISTGDLIREYEVVTADDWVGSDEYRDAVVEAYDNAGIDEGSSSDNAEGSLEGDPDHDADAAQAYTPDDNPMDELRAEGPDGEMPQGWLDGVGPIRDLFDVDSGSGAWASGLNDYTMTQLANQLEEYQDAPDSIDPYFRDKLEGLTEAADEMGIDDPTDLIEARRHVMNLGWAQAEQLQGILNGEPLGAHNPSALRNIADIMHVMPGSIRNFGDDHSFEELSDAIHHYLDNPAPDEPDPLDDSGDPDPNPNWDVIEGKEPDTSNPGWNVIADVPDAPDAGLSLAQLEEVHDLEDEGVPTDEAIAAVTQDAAVESGVAAPDNAAGSNLQLMVKSAEKASSDVSPEVAAATLNGVLDDARNGRVAEAHKTLAGLMTKMKLGGKQRKRYRELLDSFAGTDNDDSAEVQAASVAESLSADNPVKERLAAKAGVSTTPVGTTSVPTTDPDVPDVAIAAADYLYNWKTHQSAKGLPKGVKKTKSEPINVEAKSNKFRSNATSSSEITINGRVVGHVQSGKVGGSIKSKQGNYTVGWASESSGWLAFDANGKEVRGTGLTSSTVAEAISHLLRKDGLARKDPESMTNDELRDATSFGLALPTDKVNAVRAEIQKRKDAIGSPAAPAAAAPTPAPASSGQIVQGPFETMKQQYAALPVGTRIERNGDVLTKRADGQWSRGSDPHPVSNNSVAIWSSGPGGKGAYTIAVDAPAATPASPKPVKSDAELIAQVDMMIAEHNAEYGDTEPNASGLATWRKESILQDLLDGDKYITVKGEIEHTVTREQALAMLRSIGVDTSGIPVAGKA